MRAAAAQVLRQRILHLLDAGLGVALEECGAGHHHAVRAIAALRGLLGDEGGLHTVWLLDRAEAFDGGDLAAREARGRNRAGAHRLAIDQHRAGAALAEAAAVFGALQAEIVADGVQQGLFGIANVERSRAPVHRECDRRHGPSRSRRSWRAVYARATQKEKAALRAAFHIFTA